MATEQSTLGLDMSRCRATGLRALHWSSAQNKRFRLYRIDGPTNYRGRYPGAVWDADRKQWIDQFRQGIAGHELARPATAQDMRGVN